MKICLCCGIFFILIDLILPFQLQAQEESREKEMAPVSATYAIKNATVIQSPGRKIVNGTVVLKEGIILSVGKNVPIPADAIVIQGDSLFIYAGFIDGLSHAGVIKSKDDLSRERPKDPGNPSPESAGISPQNEVRNSLNPSEKSVEELRGLGFTTVHVVPYGGMLPGHGAIIQLNGKKADNMVIEDNFSFFSQLTGAPRVYPSTIIGVMAKWRELYRQSLQLKNYALLYASNRTGLNRPISDRILESFYPVIDKRMPVIFEADQRLEVNRILTLQADLGFSLMIGDLKEGWDVIEKLKASGTKVFLSLDLPEKISGEEKKDPNSPDKKTEPEKDKPKVVTPETEALEKRRAVSMALYDGQASAFQQANLKFGFSTFSAKPKDIRPNLRRMITAGLTEDQALTALTTHAAQLLGLTDRMGSVEQGKIANLVICDKPYFHEKSNVRYVFVEGIMYQYAPGDVLKSVPNLVINIVGTWTVTTEGFQGKPEEKVTIQQDGNNFSGSVTGGELEQAASLESIGLNGSTLMFSYNVQDGGQSYKVNVQATVEGDTFKGTATRGNFGNFVIEAQKDPNH